MDLDKFIALAKVGTPPFISLLAFIALVILRKPFVSLLKRLLRIKIDKTGTEIALEHATTVEDIETPIDQRALAVQTVLVEQGSVQNAIVIEKSVTFDEVGQAIEEKDREKAEKLYREMESTETNPIEKDKMEIFWNYLLTVSGDIGALSALKHRVSAETKYSENRKFAVDLLGLAYERAFAFQEAIATYQAELGLSSNEKARVDLTIKIALCENKLGLKDSAIERIVAQLNELQEQSLQSKCFATIHEFMGSSFLGLSALEKAISLRPTDPELRFKAGYESKQSTISLMHYSIALKFDSKNASTLNNMGVSCSSLGLKMKAVEFYDQSLQLGESLAAANIADKYIKAGFYENAKRVLESTNGFSEIHKNVGQKQSLMISTKSDEEDKFVASIDKGSKQHRYMVAFAEAAFQKADVVLKETAKWVDDSQLPAAVILVAQQIECIWGKDNLYKITGVFQNRAAIVDKYELEYDLIKMDRIYKFKRQSYLYATLSMNELVLMESDDNEASYISFRMSE